MTVRKSLRWGTGTAFAASIMTASVLTFAADLPKGTQKILKDFKVDQSVLSGLDQELAIPRAWIDAAKKEGTLKIMDTLSGPQSREMAAVFNERYPFIKLSFAQGTYQARTTKILVAFKVGNVPYDIASAFGGYYPIFKKNGLLSNLQDMPVFSKLNREMRDDEGTWVGYRLQYWCTTFNTNLVKKSDLPKKWDDLLDNKAWRNRNLAIGNRPQLWMLMLWSRNGEDWAKGYIHRLFSEVKPQLRREGMDTLVELAAAGEFHMALPSSEHTAYELQSRGAPIGFHCPEPIPVNFAMKGIIKGSKSPHSAKIYLNWLLSKEGQLVQAHASQSVPVRKSLLKREFIPFADQILNKQTSLRSIKIIETLGNKVNKYWAKAWINAGGPKRKRRSRKKKKK